MEKLVSFTTKLSHKQFRAILKKFRRKKNRQKLARERDEKELLEQQKRESSPGYKEREEDRRRNSELFDQFEERERIREHKLWILREQQAQEEFRRKQEKLKLEKIRSEEERKRILEQLEKQEFVEKEAEVKKVKSRKEEALQEALSNLSEADGPWHNPIAPANYNVGEERAMCMFFSKTGCCRFGERCSRGHARPAVSSTILIRGMYSHFSMDQTGRDDYDTDIALEYEDKERYQDFKDFYFDVLPEFKKFGKVIQLKVCNNFEPHLRGNVYVQYAREEHAIEAYKAFNGRYYAGRQITCDFTHVIQWRSAICGLHNRNLCPKGMNCNFLHVFKNPNDEFWEADRDLPPRERRHVSDSSRKRHDKSSHRSSEYKYRHKSRSSRYESRNDSHESRSDRYESRNERHESRSDRYEPRSERHEYRSNRYERRHESRSSSRHDFKKSYRSGSSSHSSDDDDDHSPGSKKIKNDFNCSHRKRSRNSSSRSKSKSPSESSNQKKRNRKKKKLKKKKSKNHKRQESDVHNSTDDNSSETIVPVT